MTDATHHPVAWTEIPVTDMQAAMEFYNKAMDFGLTIDTTGPNPVAMIPTPDGNAVAGHLYPGKPGKGAGPTIHFNVPGTVEAALEKWVAAGGRQVYASVIEIPPGRFAYVQDPDGNSIGLFEAKRM